MAKRSRSYRRSIDEMKRDLERAYRGMEKFPSKINPIFLQKPYSACAKKVEDETDDAKN